MDSTVEIVTLTKIDCGVCAGTYAINERYRQQRYEEGKSWTCPYCKTGWGYDGRGENAELRRELKKKNDRLAREISCHDRTKADLRETESKRRGEKAAKTRIKNRIKAGVCPYCRRNFVALGQHIRKQHPGERRPQNARPSK